MASVVLQSSVSLTVYFHFNNINTHYHFRRVAELFSIVLHLMYCSTFTALPLYMLMHRFHDSEFCNNFICRFDINASVCLAIGYVSVNIANCTNQFILTAFLLFTDMTDLCSPELYSICPYRLSVDADF